jgi:hypothetical protein
MSRGTKLFLLTHLYAIFIVWFMECCDWCIRCSLMFYLVPSVLICLIIDVIQAALHRIDQLYCNFLKYFVVWVNVYYTICAYKKSVDSSPGHKVYLAWVNAHTNFFLYFVILVIIFYISLYLWHAFKRMD